MVPTCPSHAFEDLWGPRSPSSILISLTKPFVKENLLHIFTNFFGVLVMFSFQALSVRVPLDLVAVMPSPSYSKEG